MEIQKLQWDSDFFGLEVYRLMVSEPEYDIQSITKTIDSIEGDIFYIFHDGDDTVSSKELFSKEPNDIKINFSIDLTKFKIDEQTSDDVAIERFSPSDSVEQLYQLAYQSGHKSRFKTDSHFSKENFESLYRIWVDNSISHKIADYVFVSKQNGDINGFITLKINNGEASIGLIAVDSKSKRLGIGRKLVNKAIYTLRYHSVNKLYVATQKANVGACQFYRNLGFEIETVTSIYHIWPKHIKPNKNKGI